jgi:DNA recombination protein Rad52
MTFTTEQMAMLEAKLDPKHVKKPSGKFGPKGDYLEAWHVINEMNRVFGFGGWSYTISLTQDALEQAENTRGEAQWQAAYTCDCTLSVRTTDGIVVRQDVGFGSGFAKQIGDAIEGATKEAATDSLKRAARTFGNVFGLALYDKARANVEAPPPPTITDGQRLELMALLDRTGVKVGPILKQASKNAGREIPDLGALPATEYDGLKDYLITKRTNTHE